MKCSLAHIFLAVLMLPGAGAMMGLSALAADSIKPTQFPATQTVGSIPTRVLHFPPNRSLGMLHTHDPSLRRQTGIFNVNDGGLYDKWVYIGEAQGDVRVPEGWPIRLSVGKNAWRDLSPLAHIPPDAIEEITLQYDEEIDDRCMPFLARLTGLKILHLGPSAIGDTGIRHLRDMPSLEYLSLPARITDSGLLHIAENVRSLKAVNFGTNRCTNTGVLHLAKLPALDELVLGSVAKDQAGRSVPCLINDAGLVHLARYPRLRHLKLWGGFTDAGMIQLKNIPALGTLDLMHLPISDAGVANLVGCANLQVLNLYNTEVTDRGLPHLRAFPLLRELRLNKAPGKVDLKNPPITDAGLAVLGQITTLEYLDLPVGITDAGLAELTRLERLRHLWASTYGNSEIGDAGFKSLGRLQALEELYIGSKYFTADGMEALAALPRLKKLLINAFTSSPGSLASLGRIKSLEELDVSTSRGGMRLSDINGLSGLPELRSVHATDLTRDGVALKLTGVPRLETLRLLFDKKATWTDEDMVCLADLKRLKWLWLGGFGGPGRMSDAGAAQLAGLVWLERLGFGGPELTDRGLVEIAKLPRLWEVNVSGNFTDAGLEALMRQTNLQRLTIRSGRDFTPAVVSRLHTALYNTHIFEVKKDKALGK